MTARASDLEQEVDRILGRPFRWLERGPAYFYCLGVWLYLMDRRGIHVEDPFIEASEARLCRFWRLFQEVPKDALLPYDLLYWRWADQSHVVVVTSGRWAVSCSEQLGVHRTPLRLATVRAEKAYRYQGAS